MEGSSMTTPRKDDRLSFRVSPEAKATLRQAAAESHEELTQFVLSAALLRAEQVLADRTRFDLDDASWARFQEALDAPAAHNPRLAKLLTEPSILESSE